MVNKKKKGGETMDNKDYVLYVHIFPDSKLYFGITKQNVLSRWNKGNGYKTQQRLYSAIQFYGWDNIEHKIIETGLTAKEAQEKEKYYIKKYDTINQGYNTSEGGNLGGSEWVEVEYNGEIYSPSELEELAVDGVTAHDITTRLGRGWSVDRALTQEKGDKVYEYEYNGAIYSIDELYALRKIDIDRTTFLNRIRNGWSIDRALTQPQGKKNQPYLNYYKYNGKEYNIQQLVGLSGLEGMSEATMRDRINRGWSLEKAITQPLKKRDALYEYKGKFYTTKQLAELSPYEMTHHHIADRLKGGWDIEKILNTPIKKNII